MKHVKPVEVDRPRGHSRVTQVQGFAQLQQEPETKIEMKT